MEVAIDEFIRGKKALVIEDEAAICQLLKINLMQLGFEVTTCPDAETALPELEKGGFNLCLLDWMLPGMQGVDFLKKVRPGRKNLKIMMVTAKADADSIVAGLESGADDYLAKPFDARVLAARVRHLMRSLMAELPKSSTEEQMTFEGLTLHFTKHIVKYRDQDIHLTPSEFKLLVALVKAQGQVLTRDQLIALIQGEDISVTGRTIDTHIFALRKKIGAWSKYVETIRGVGYRILLSTSDTSEPEVS